jgi:hypothetical protein
MIAFWDISPCSHVEVDVSEDVDDDLDHVDVVNPRLWTAATKGSVVHPPGDI